DFYRRHAHRRIRRPRGAGALRRPRPAAEPRNWNMTTTNDEQPAAPPPAGSEAQTGPQLLLQAVYLKDCSYEAPNGPRVEGNWNPHINLDLHTAVNSLSPELREVVLTVTVSAKQGETTLFLVEVKQ